MKNLRRRRRVQRHRLQPVCVLKFADAECAKKALEQLNGFELAGRPMKVGHVTERSDSSTASSFLDNDELERTGIDLGTTGRLQLMARLAEGRLFSCIVLYQCRGAAVRPTDRRYLFSAGTGLKIPPAAQQALQMTGSIPFGGMGAPAGEARRHAHDVVCFSRS